MNGSTKDNAKDLPLIVPTTHKRRGGWIYEIVSSPRVSVSDKSAVAAFRCKALGAVRSYCVIQYELVDGHRFTESTFDFFDTEADAMALFNSTESIPDSDDLGDSSVDEL